MEVDEEEEEGGRKQYDWEGEGRPHLASEAAVGTHRRDGHMEYGGVLFTGSEVAATGTEVFRRGLARALVVAYDWGASMTQTEPPPLRSAFVLGQLTAFVGEFFAANPLSQLALISTSEGMATRVSALGSAPSSHVAALAAAAAARECEGEISLQHCVELAVAQLRHCPSHVSREVLLVVSALSTCDPGDLRAAALSAKQARVRISVLHLSAQVYAAEQLCRVTEGIHAVMVDKHHFQQLLRAHVPPPIDHRPPGEAVALVATGFPLPSAAGPVLCLCHRRLTDAPLHCPNCRAAVCELPSSCPICALPLVAASHLARSYRHLFPVAPFEPLVLKAWQHCGGCHAVLHTTLTSFRCTACKDAFCPTCNDFVHTQLFNCPSCLKAAN